MQKKILFLAMFISSLNAIGQTAATTSIFPTAAGSGADYHVGIRSTQSVDYRLSANGSVNLFGTVPASGYTTSPSLQLTNTTAGTGNAYTITSTNGGLLQLGRLSAGAITPSISINSSGYVGIGVTAPTSLLHLPVSGQLSIGTPDLTSTQGAALTSNELRFRSATNYYMAMSVNPGGHEMQIINKNSGALGGIRVDLLKANNILSINNYTVASILDGQLKVGGQMYPTTSMYVKENYAVPDYFPALTVESQKSTSINPLVPLSLHIRGNDGADNFYTGISFGGTNTVSGSYTNNQEASVSVLTSNSNGTTMYFSTTDNIAAGGQKRMTITPGGIVGIGTITPNSSARLDVNGKIFCNDKIYIGVADAATAGKIAPYALAVNGDAIFNKAKVKLYTSWPDFVFESQYGLLPIADLEQYIKANKHLPNIPSAAEVEKSGIDLGGNQALLLQKIEELTLYIIEVNKKVEKLTKENEGLKKTENR